MQTPALRSISLPGPTVSDDATTFTIGTVIKTDSKPTLQYIL